MMRNDALAARPVLPARLGVAMSRYFAGFRVRPASRPVKRKLLTPAPPASVKLPRTLTSRVHLRALRFALVRLTQRPSGALAPGVGFATLKRPFAPLWGL